MVSNSDLQKWQNSVNGINESGKTDLTQEEWSALSVLNDCLSSGNIISEDSYNCYKTLQDSINQHTGNPALQRHLYDFLSLCYTYATAQPPSTMPSTSVNQPTTSNTNSTEPAIPKSVPTVQLVSTEPEEKVKCPHCGSEQIQVVKKGYNTTKGCCGYAICGPLGFLFGQHNAGVIEKVCIKCGHKW